MAVTAYLLIQTEVGQAAHVVDAIREIDGVVSADDVTGPYDVIVVTAAESIDDLELDGLDATTKQVGAALLVDNDQWKAECAGIREHFEKFGDHLPAVLWTELDGLKARLGL